MFLGTHASFLLHSYEPLINLIGCMISKVTLVILVVVAILKGTGVLSMAKDYWLQFLYFQPDLSEFLKLQGICVILKDAIMTGP